MMERCKTCRWWDSVGYFSPQGEHSTARCTSDVRLCHCDKILEWPEVMDDGKRRGQVIEQGVISTRTQWRVDQDEAMVMDGSDYMAKFATGPEFGCVHWQAKEGSDG